MLCDNRAFDKIGSMVHQYVRPNGFCCESPTDIRSENSQRRFGKQTIQLAIDQYLPKKRDGFDNPLPSPSAPSPSPTSHKCQVSFRKQTIDFRQQKREKITREFAYLFRANWSNWAEKPNEETKKKKKERKKQTNARNRKEKINKE